MKRILTILAIFVISNIDLYSQQVRFDVPEFPNEQQQKMIDKRNADDSYRARLYRVKRGSEDPADIALTEGYGEYVFATAILHMFSPDREVWRWSYNNLKVDTLSIVNDAIIPILDYYDGKEGYNDDYDVDYLCLHDNIADDYHANRIDAYRKYYTLRIDVVRGDTIAYYHITDKPIEDIFADKERMDQFGEVLGYINYNKKPILVSGNGAEAFFKVEGNIVMSPTYKTRVECSPNTPTFITGDTKGFYIYKDGTGFEFLRTGVIPYWQDREFFLDDIRRARYGNPYTFVPYVTTLPQLPSDRLEQYRVVKRKRR